MDDNMNKDFEEEIEETAFGTSEYYKKLYNDFPEDIAEMLIGTHPLMKKEVSDELTHSIKIRSARQKNLRAVREAEEIAESSEEMYNDFEETTEMVSASKDPVDEFDDGDLSDYVGDITSFTKGLVSDAETVEEEFVMEEEVPDYGEKSEDDITAERIAAMLGGVGVEPVEEEEFDDYDDFEGFEEEIEERPRKRAKREPHKEDRTIRRRKQRTIDEKDLELSNIEKQADLNELFREDDDYYEEKQAGHSVARIAIIVAAIVVLAFFIFKLASLSGQVTKLESQIETYKTMEVDYEQLKLDNLALTEKVETLEAQLSGANQNTENIENTTDTENSTTASTNTSAKTYTVKNGDTFWGIATKMYGNGSYYTRILRANNLTENSTLREGMTLTIPAA